MDVREKLVEVQRELCRCQTMLGEKAHAAHCMGMNELGQTLQFVANKLVAQEEVLHALAGEYITERFAAAQAASANVLQSALAGIELASQEKPAAGSVADTHEQELRAAVDVWRQYVDET